MLSPQTSHSNPSPFVVFFCVTGFDLEAVDRDGDLVEVALDLVAVADFLAGIYSSCPLFIGPREEI
jgi:hypothetical protein